MRQAGCRTDGGSFSKLTEVRGTPLPEKGDQSGEKTKGHVERCQDLERGTHFKTEI